jgi:hypothetical protein
VVFAALRVVQSQLDTPELKLIPQTLYPSHREMIIAPDMPCVGKTGNKTREKVHVIFIINIGSAHAGKGKIKIESGEVRNTMIDLKIRSNNQLSRHLKITHLLSRYNPTIALLSRTLNGIGMDDCKR